jgi:hypothetical protein
MARKRRAILLIAAAAFALMQIIPAAPSIDNPPSDTARGFDTVMKPSATVASVLRRACYDCHSHETRWPWYSYVAPVSWPIRHHVANGRRALNFSEWLRPGEKEFTEWSSLEEICHSIRDGSMPMPSYLPFHPEAALSKSEKEMVCAWVDRALARGSAFAAGPSAIQ